MSSSVYTEPKYILINTEQKKSQQIKQKKKHKQKRANIIPKAKSEENSLDEYLHTSGHESFQDLLVRFIYGFILPL
ncbi:MAG: hypothetical protein F6K40_21465 [Okeania sp. SIO3I5]|uniref:hypothetical protein n=1 Tax=Okeania sp. SIO3I5 TaxID=2607805 RepID=UPI0013BB90A4|nr:hypothetical protein [Okeania sp. SIO3I5]NEQ38697.1 hypothetical protein [Okeania sp. SIO3I5]